MRYQHNREEVKKSHSSRMVKKHNRRSCAEHARQESIQRVFSPQTAQIDSMQSLACVLRASQTYEGDASLIFLASCLRANSKSKSNSNSMATTCQRHHLRCLIRRRRRRSRCRCHPPPRKLRARLRYQYSVHPILTAVRLLSSSRTEQV